MNRYTPLNAESFTYKRWFRPTNYRFALQDRTVPIFGAEIGPAAGTMPLGFLRIGGAYELVGLLAVAGSRNVFVDLSGRWLGSYVPFLYRTAPFRIVNGADGQRVMCVDVASELVTGSQTGEPFYLSSGRLSDSVTRVRDELERLEPSKALVERAVTALDKAGVIREWRINDARPELVDCLHRIDEVALESLPADVFLALRDASALTLAYAQIVSMVHVMRLRRMEAVDLMTEDNLEDIFEKVSFS